MLAIRMQRTGRKGHAMFRMVVQDSRRTPTSGKVVAFLGSYDPHAKTVILDKEKATLFLSNGAQPSDRVALLFKREGVILPNWVETATKKSGTIRHTDKLRRNRPAEEKVEEPVAVEAEAPAEETPAEPAATPVADKPADEPSDAPAEEPVETPADETDKPSEA